jgi:hypothetical protein
LNLSREKLVSKFAFSNSTCAATLRSAQLYYQGYQGGACAVDPAGLYKLNPVDPTVAVTFDVQKVSYGRLTQSSLKAPALVSTLDPTIK